MFKIQVDLVRPWRCLEIREYQMNKISCLIEFRFFFTLPSGLIFSCYNESGTSTGAFFFSGWEWNGRGSPSQVKLWQSKQRKHKHKLLKIFLRVILNTCLLVMNHRYSKFRYKLLVLDLEIKYMQASRSNMNK